MSEERLPYVRLAKRKELKYIAKMMQRAFISDPSHNYLAGLTKPLTTTPKDCFRRRTLRKYFLCTLNICWSNNTRITVTVIPQQAQNTLNSRKQERIISCAVWKPPNQPEGEVEILPAIRAGILHVWLGWGWGMFERMHCIAGPLEEAVKKGLAKMKTGTTSEDVRYLQLAATDPDYQGKGMFSLLMREAFSHDPLHDFALDACSASARDKYEHFGFVVMEEVTIGKGEVDTNGMLSLNGCGYKMYPMVRSAREGDFYPT